jgi:hypothetical protein
MTKNEKTKEQTLYEEIRAQLEPFDRLDLISKLAGLRLHPKNGGRSLRLDFLLHIAASMNHKEGKKIKRKSMEAIGNSKLIKEEIALNEDPMSELFCDEIGFIGGGYRVFPGPTPSLVFNFKTLLKTLFSQSNNNFPTHLKHELKSQTLFVLNVSEKIADRIDIKRYTGSEDIGTLFVPFEKELELLGKATVFHHEELYKIALSCKTDMEEIKWLFSKSGEVDPDSYNFENGDLLERPILKINDLYVVTDPSALLGSFMQRVLIRMQEENFLEAFAQTYNLAVWDSVQKYIERMNVHKLKGWPSEHRKEISLIDGGFIFDTDKCLIVFLVGDNFLELDQNQIRIDPCQIEQRRDEIVKSLCSQKYPPNEFLFLYVLSDYRRAISFSFPKPERSHQSFHIPMSADGLEIISILEMGKSLFLYKYGKAKEVSRQKSKVVSIEPLSEYELFRKCEYSFYVSDKARPNLLLTSDDFAQSAKLEAMRRLDPHYVYNPDRNSVSEMIRIHDGSTPLYFSESFMRSKLYILLEDLPIPIWFFSGSALHMSKEIIEMLGYWFYELKDFLTLILEPIKHHIRYLKFYISISDPTLWTVVPRSESKTKKSSKNDSSSGLVIEMKYPTIINLKFYPKLTELLYDETNKGERYIITLILKSFGRLCDYLKISTDQLSESIINDAINKFIPLGRKKKLNLYDAGHFPEIIPDYLPEIRFLDPIDVNFLLDEIGDYITDMGLSTRTDQNEQSKFINEYVVKYLWHKLRDEIRTIRGDTLLLYLISKNEAITRRREILDLQLPMRLEIKSWEEAFSDYSEDHKEISLTASACRFLVECAISYHPSGYKPISHALYDKLLATASAIIDWGFTSDLIAYGIGNFKIRILPSNRIGHSSSQVDEAFHRFSDEYLKHKTYHLTQYASNYSNKENSQTIDKEKKNKSVEVSPALKKEFGFRMEELMKMDEFLKGIAPQTNYIIRVAQDELIEILRKKISEEAILSIIKTFSLCQRANYFSHPGYKDIPFYEFYPWRFNRGFSHMRRPLLKIQAGSGVYLLVGYRHWRKSLRNFFNLLNNGRLLSNAQTKEFKRLITKMSQPYGERFNREIAKLLTDRPHYNVYQNIKKFGKKRLEVRKGISLGDIDVLAINAKKYKIFIIECKNLLIARTPYELKFEIQKVFEDEKSHISKHQKRTEWIKENLQIVLDHFGLKYSKKWQVRSLFVHNEPLFSSHFKKAKGMRILSSEEFRDLIEMNKL